MSRVLCSAARVVSVTLRAGVARVVRAAQVVVSVQGKLGMMEQWRDCFCRLCFICVVWSLGVRARHIDARSCTYTVHRCHTAQRIKERYIHLLLTALFDPLFPAVAVSSCANRALS